CDTCEAIDERIIPALGHALISYVGKAATCTEAGWNDYDTCARCDYTTYQAIDALEHQYLASVIAPTCLNQGYTIHSCSRCPSVYIDTYVTALGHDLSHHDAKAPTCTKVGYKEYDTCSRCDYTTYQKVAALGHDYQETVIAPTCLAQGYTEHTCSRCQNSYADTYVNALGHDITHHNAQAPTCIAVGWESYDTCSRCDYTTYQEIPPSGHTPVIDAGIAATCTQAGLTEGSHCSVCHAILVEQQIIAQGEHVAAAPTQEDLLSPTCLTAGAYNAVVYCSLCSVKLSSSEVILPALGHDYLATHHAADCIRYERNEWACSRCDAAYTETLSHTLMPHQYMAYTCSVCQRDEMSDYTERFESGEVVTLTSIREIAILIDYLIFYHNTAGIRFMMEGMTTENYNSYISQANKMCTNTNWALQFSATTKAGVLQSVRLFCAQNYDFDLVATITPESGDYSPTHYQQQDFLSIQNAAERASDYDDFPYQTRLYPLEVSTSDQLFFAFEHGYRPIPVPDSTAERMLNSAKAVNREILNDDMTDRDKVYRVMQWLVENVSYDYGAAGNTSINHFYASAYYLEGAFDYRLAVCDAYAKAICVMLGLEDIKCVRVTGNQHAWNRVYIDLNGDGSKEWYVVDATHADCGVSDANAEVLSLKQFLISDSQKTDLGYTANNYQDENALAITENNPFALCYYGNEGTSADYVITNKSEMKTLFSAVSAQLSAGTTDYFTVNIFVPKSYCSTSSSLISTLQKYVPRTFAYINHEVTYNGVSGWNSIILLYQ
ncbi:MAG: transglutaminase domain-containing protein, partial [Clostridia bacterium]|nr:transglutaminase domain-containing protein [Clostridia bacterium]